MNGRTAATRELGREQIAAVARRRGRACDQSGNVVVNSVQSQYKSLKVTDYKFKLEYYYVNVNWHSKLLINCRNIANMCVTDG